MMATLVTERLLGGEGVGNFLGAGTCLAEMFGDLGALFGGKCRDGGQDPAKGDGNIVNVVHQAYGFSRQRHDSP